MAGCMLALIGRAEGGAASPIRRGVMLSEGADDGEVSDAEWDGEESDDMPARKHASRTVVKRARRTDDDMPRTAAARQCVSKPQPALVVGQHDGGVAAALRLATNEQLMHELQRRLSGQLCRSAQPTRLARTEASTKDVPGPDVPPGSFSSTLYGAYDSPVALAFAPFVSSLPLPLPPYFTRPMSMSPAGIQDTSIPPLLMPSDTLHLLQVHFSRSDGHKL